MTTALDGKFTIVTEVGVYTQGAENEDSCRNILCRGGLHHAIGHDGLFLGGPERQGSADKSNGQRIDDFGAQYIRQGGTLEAWKIRDKSGEIGRSR